MNKRLIRRLMHSSAGPLSSFGPYYFRSDFEYILQGLCFEYTPSGVYVATFCFPLFDSFGINLTFSERLKQQKGFIAKESMTEEAMVDFVLASPEARSVLVRNKSIGLPEFIGNIESLAYDWQSTRITLIYVASMLLLGQDIRTSRLLKTFPARSALGVRDLSAWDQLGEKLQEGLEPAKTLLEQVRHENLRALGLAA